MMVLCFLTFAASVCMCVCEREREREGERDRQTERERELCYTLRSLMRFLHNTFPLTDLFTAFAIHV